MILHCRVPLNCVLHRFPQRYQKHLLFCLAVASVCNVILMRHSELFTGIEVMDSDDKVVGVSKTAAAKALQQTAATRAFLPAPILLIPPIMMTLLER